MPEYESFRVQFEDGVQFDVTAEGWRVKMAVKPVKGEIAYIEMTGHDLLRLTEFLKVIGVGVVTRGV